MFEKRRGEGKGMEKVVLEKRRLFYEEQLKTDRLNYDLWFDYIGMEEMNVNLILGDFTDVSDVNEQISKNPNVIKVREIYERAIACLPPAEEKKYWRRYIYLWIKYALFEELQCKV
jgi:crooked neck